MCLSLFLPWLGRVGWKANKQAHAVIALVASCALVLAFNGAVPVAEGSFYNSIYTDCALGLLIASLLAIVALGSFSDIWAFFSFSLLLVFTTLSKQMGFPLALMSACFLAIRLLIIGGAVGRTVGSRIVNALSKAAALCVVTLLTYASWKAYVASVGASAAAMYDISDVNLSMLAGIAQGTAGEPWQHTTLINYFNQLLFGKSLIFGLNYSSACMMALTVLCLCLCLCLDVESIGRRSAVMLVAFCAATALLYAVGIGLVYTFEFGPHEGPMLGSYSRYMQTIVYAILAVGVFVFLSSRLSGSFKLSQYVCVCALTLSLVPVSVWQVALSPLFEHRSATEQFDSDAAFLLENTREASSIYLVSLGSNGLDNYSLWYLANPRRFNDPHYRYDADPADVAYHKVEVSDFKSELSDYDYLYLRNIDDSFISDGYSEAAGIADVPTSGQLYALNGSGGAELISTIS